MKVKMLDLGAQDKVIGDRVRAAILEVLDSQRFILGPDVCELEREVAAYCGVAHAVGCASGSDALLLCLMALGVGPGDEVITSPYTFFATAGAIVRLGAKPVFVDIRRDTFNIDVEKVEKAITKQTKGIIPVHLFGQSADMSALVEVAGKYGVWIVEDAAQAIGAQYCGKRVGGFGVLAAFSFYPSKNLGGAGDGGMITTDSSDLAELLRVLRVHGARRRYYHDYVGINSRLDTIQAAVLRVKLSYLDEWINKRRVNAFRYRVLFEESGLTENGSVILPIESMGCYHTYNQFVIRAVQRNALRLYLMERGVETEVYYPRPLHLQRCFESFGYKSGMLPESEQAASEALALPIYPEIGEQAQTYVVEQIRSFYSNGMWV
jgi:dTDP-4-amino-4,6-dideoxygalactose transaminase